MKYKSQALGSLWQWLTCLIAVLALSGCGTIKLVGDYDAQIDNGTTALQREVETFLVKLETSAAKPADPVDPYANNKQFYSDVRVAISGLRVRADAIERNSLTVRAFDKLAANVDALEAMHKGGITRVEISKLIRPGFTQQFTAILSFELAKKRGDTPDEMKSSAPATPAQTDIGAKK